MTNLILQKSESFSFDLLEILWKWGKIAGYHLQIIFKAIKNDKIKMYGLHDFVGL